MINLTEDMKDKIRRSNLDPYVQESLLSEPCDRYESYDERIRDEIENLLDNQHGLTLDDLTDEEYEEIKQSFETVYSKSDLDERLSAVIDEHVETIEKTRGFGDE